MIGDSRAYPARSTNRKMPAAIGAAGPSQSTEPLLPTVLG
jgi:hypothetical protein